MQCSSASLHALSIIKTTFVSCCKVNMLKERNKNYNAINFVDISSEDYSPEDNQGLDYETVCL